MQRGNSQTKRFSGKRRFKSKRRARRLLFFSAVLLILIIVCACFIVSCANRVAQRADTALTAPTEVFAGEVYVDSTLISGMTLAQANALLSSHAEYLLQNAVITLRNDVLPQGVYITAGELQASTDLAAVLQQALMGGAGQQYHTTLSIDDAALNARLDEIGETLLPAPTDAALAVSTDGDGKPVFHYTEGINGLTLDVAATAQKIREMFANGEYQAMVAPVLTEAAPAVTVADLKANVTLVGSFTTSYNYRGTAESTEQEREFLIPNRAFNVEKSAAMINGVVVQPGKSFSFNKVVGDRTEENGWRQANGIFGGDRYTLQYGGGVCQVSTTLYNALLQCYSNIEIIHRQKHSIPSSYVEPGLDATVDSNHIDFSFRNVSDAPLYLFAYYTTNKWATNRRRDLTVLVYGKALPEGTVYRPRTETMEELLPGEPIIEYDPRQPEGMEEIVVQARNGYVVDVFLDRFVNEVLVETIYICTDTYEAKTEKRIVGTMALATTAPSAASGTPTPDPAA